MLLEERLEELKAEFGELDEPFQRYSLLLQLAAYAPQPPCDFTTDEHLFRGCQTKVWLSVRRMDGQPDIRITSDSMLLRGVGLVLMRLLNGLPQEEYQALARWDIPACMGLAEMFTSQRQQGISRLLAEIEEQTKLREETTETGKRGTQVC